MNFMPPASMFAVTRELYAENRPFRMTLFTSQVNLLSTKLRLGLMLTFAITVMYYGLQALAIGDPIYMHPIVIDRLVVLNGAAIWIYLSLFPLLILVPLRLNSYFAVNIWFRGMLVISIISATIFLLCPTAVHRPGEPLSWLHGIILITDGDRNAFPSLHASLAVFNGYLSWQYEHSGFLRSALIFWITAILWSTLATGQHVFLDIAGGAILGFIIAGLAVQGKLFSNMPRGHTASKFNVWTDRGE